MADESFIMTHHGSDGKPDLPKAPDDVAGKLTWLKAMTEEEERLKRIEKEFKATGNAEPLKEFISPKSTFNSVGVIENIPHPSALWQPINWTEKDIQQHHDDVKRLFPEAELLKVTCTDGVTCFAYTGIETHAMLGAVGLVEKERAVAEAIREQSEKLGKYTPVNNPDRVLAQQGIEILPTPAQAVATQAAKKGSQLL